MLVFACFAYFAVSNLSLAVGGPWPRVCRAALAMMGLCNGFHLAQRRGDAEVSMQCNSVSLFVSAPRRERISMGGICASYLATRPRNNTFGRRETAALVGSKPGNMIGAGAFSPGCGS